MAKAPSLRLGRITALDRLPPGDVRTAIESMQGMLRDIEQWANLVTRDPAPPAGDVMHVMARDEDGNYSLYKLVAGAGMTIVRNSTTKTITLTSP